MDEQDISIRVSLFLKPETLFCSCDPSSIRVSIFIYTTLCCPGNKSSNAYIKRVAYTSDGDEQAFLKV